MPDENTSNVIDDKTKDDQDPIKQVKAEFSRKHKETSEVLAQMQATQAALAAALEKIAKPKKAEDDEDLEKLMYSDPKAYARKIKDEAKQEVLAEIRQESSSQASVQQTIAKLQNEYPELADENNELTKATVAILKEVSEAEKTNPRTYEHAVLKAANAMDIKPRSKRPIVEDDLVAPTYTSPQARSKKRSTDTVINQNKDVAKALGVNLDDPKMKERYINLLKQKGIV